MLVYMLLFWLNLWSNVCCNVSGQFQGIFTTLTHAEQTSYYCHWRWERKKKKKLDIYLLERKKKKKTLTWNVHNQHAQEPHFNSKEKGKRLHLLRVHACVHILNLEEDDKTTLHSFWHSHIQHLNPDIHIRPCHHRHNLKCASWQI